MTTTTIPAVEPKILASFDIGNGEQADVMRTRFGDWEGGAYKFCLIAFRVDDPSIVTRIEHHPTDALAMSAAIVLAARAAGCTVAEFSLALLNEVNA